MVAMTGRKTHSYAIGQRGFSLIELLVVIAIIVLVTAFIVPAFTSIKSGGDVTSAAYTIKAVLDQARTYALANNSYTYVGFYEEAATATSPTNATPPYPGKGRVVLATVASIDGTTSCEDPAATTTNRIPLTPSKITQIGKLVRIQNIHIADVGPPPSPTPSPWPDLSSLAGRPSYPYTNGSPSVDYQNRVSSDDTHSPYNQTLYPFSAQGYTFYKTLRFDPRGEVNINSTYTLRNQLEIGLWPARGDIVDTGTLNVVAIQVSGVGGNVKIYRR